MTTENVKVPTWFYVVSAILLLWNIMGVMSFFAHVFITEEALMAYPENERALFDQYPFWTQIAFAVAVFGGTIGCLGLLFKKAWSKLFFIASLIGIIAQMSHSMLATDHIDVYGPGSLVMPFMIIAIGALMVYLSNRWIKNGWLS